MHVLTLIIVHVDRTIPATIFGGNCLIWTFARLTLRFPTIDGITILNEVELSNTMKEHFKKKESQPPHLPEDFADEAVNDSIDENVLIIAKLQEELEEAKDKQLRILAELENYRNRMNRIIEEDRKYASVDLARAILPVWDNMGRALEVAKQDAPEDDPRYQAIIDGLSMMCQQFVDVFRQQQIEQIDAMHKPFDPNYEESIASLPNGDYPPGTVIAETQKGFKLHGRVIRPSQVVLAAPIPVQ